MSNIVLSPNASGTGSLTIAAPNTNTNRTLTLPDVTGTVVSTGDSGTVSQTMLASGVAGNGPTFSAYNNATQTISNTTFTKVSLQIKEWDTNNNFDNTTNYRFTPSVAGYYQVNGAVSFSNSVSCLVAVYKNGTEYRRSVYNNTASSMFNTCVNVIVYLNGSTDYIELYVYQSSVSTQTLANTSANFFQAALVRAA